MTPFQSTQIGFVVIQQMGHTFREWAFPVKGISCNTRNMSDPNTVIRKRRGRPRVPELPVVSFRLDPDWRQDIDDWRSGEPGNLSRSDAFRLLMMRGLSAAYGERKQAARKG